MGLFLRREGKEANGKVLCTRKVNQTIILYELSIVCYAGSGPQIQMAACQLHTKHFACHAGALPQTS